MELGENLNSQFAKEKTDLETEITSKLNEQHSEEVNSVKEQWKNKYTELKQKVGTTLKIWYSKGAKVPSIVLVAKCLQ